MFDDDPSELTTTARLLALLGLLQSRPDWSGPRLAEQLGVTVRTVRRDVERLRLLGYPVVATAGTRGGYHLGPGGRAMPPLMLDRDEAVAVAVCLRSAATDSIEGGGEAAVRALGKLEQLLPADVRRQVGTIGTMTERLDPGGHPVDPEVLVTLTRACRDGERLRVRYRDRRQRETERLLEPYRVVSASRRWYLVARDVEHGGWRTWRVDRLDHVEATGHRVEVVDPPDAVALVQAALTTAPYQIQVRVELDAPLAAVAEVVPPTVGTLTSLDDVTTLLMTGGDRLDWLAFHLLALDMDFTVLEPPELVDQLTGLHDRIGTVLGRTSVAAMNASNEDVAQSTADTEAAMEPQSVPVNVFEASEALVVVAPMPAVKSDDVRVELHPGDPASLRFWARVRSSGPREYLIREWEYGGYERQVDLPAGYGGGLDASLHNGQLVIRVHRGTVHDRHEVTPT